MNKTNVVQPYLTFGGCAEEAIEFYKTVLGAEVEMLMRFKDNPDACMPGVDENKILHSSLRIGGSTIMATDGGCTEAATFAGFSLSLSVATPEEGQKYFDVLAEGGEVQMAMGPTFFSPGFGMVKDRFGVSWMIVAMPK